MMFTYKTNQNKKKPQQTKKENGIIIISHSMVTVALIDLWWNTEHWIDSKANGNMPAYEIWMILSVQIYNITTLSCFHCFHVQKVEMSLNSNVFSPLLFINEIVSYAIIKLFIQNSNEKKIMTNDCAFLPEFIDWLLTVLNPPNTLYVLIEK